MPDITLTSPDGEFTGYLAQPSRSPAPGILVIQEIFGVNQDMRAHCDQLAADGYIALCPDLFWRQEPGIQLTDKTDAEWQRAFALYQGFDVDKGVADLKVALAYLRAAEGCTGRVGSVGFCLGGLLAYLMATRSDADCNVSYYGVGIDDKLDEASKISKPVLLHIAEEDEFVNKDAQAKIRAALADHAQVAVHVYPAVNHAFARNQGIHYDAQAASLATQRTADFFRSQLA